MAIGDNFNIHGITAYDLLSLADEANISFSFLKKRVASLSTVIINNVSTLSFGEFALDEKSLSIIEELKQLVTQQANALFDESLIMAVVAKEAF